MSMASSRLVGFISFVFLLLCFAFPLYGEESETDAAPTNPAQDQVAPTPAPQTFTSPSRVPRPPVSGESVLRIKTPLGKYPDTKKKNNSNDGPLKISRILDGDPNPAPAAPSKPTPPAEPTAPTPVKPKAAPPKKPAAVVSPTAPKPNPAKSGDMQSLVAGQAKLEQLVALWGPSISQSIVDGRKLLVFDSNGFERIEATLENDQLETLFLVLDQPTPAEKVRQQLKIVESEGAKVHDEFGVLLGLVYPERGALFSYAPEERKFLVESVVIQRPTAEAYLIRAQGYPSERIEAKLADLNAAVELESFNAAAWHEIARLKRRLGQLPEALDAAQTAASGVGAKPEYRLTRALIQAELGHYDDAYNVTQSIAENTALPNEVRARAYCQWGDLTARGPNEDVRTALSHHQKAIKLAAEEIRNPLDEVRRAAKLALVDAHLAVAADLAAGQWQNREMTVPKWIDSTQAFVSNLIEKEGFSRELELARLSKAVSAYNYFESDYDTTDAVDSILSVGRQLLSQTSDPTYQAVIEWEMSQALIQAATIEQNRGEFDDAMRIARETASLLDHALETRQLSISDRMTLGHFYFRVGAAQVVGNADHDEAVRWYADAEKQFTHPDIQNVAMGQRGEALASMAVSYWESGRKEQGLQLTEQGAALIKQGVDAGENEMNALVAPYSNLITMYENQGDAAKQAEYADKLAKLPKPAAAEPSRR
ncbi:MAG: tetratricopeptide repeat protein [Blastopirellula sp. JB062]